MNKQYPKEEYFEVIKIIKDEDIAHHKKHVLEEESIIGSENCTGSEMINCKNCHHSHNGFMAENCKYCLNFGDMVDAYDCSAFGHKCSLSIENIAGEEDHHVGFTFAILNAKKVRFSLYCINSSHLFGCIGLRNQEYCIFNKQYTKEEYNKLVPQIIEHMKKTGEWGEFFHPSLSPFGYNETVANEYFPVQPPSIPPSGGSSDAAVPLSGGEGLGVRKLQDLGYKRSDYEAPTPQVDKIVPGEKLPAQGCAIIQEKKPEFLQDILKYAIRCEKSQKLFRLIPQEIAFYTKHDLPLPRRHPDVRHAERMEMRR